MFAGSLQPTYVQDDSNMQAYQGRHRFNTSGGAILENYSLYGAARPKVNTRSLDGSRKSGGTMPSNSKSGGAKAPPASPSVPPLPKLLYAVFCRTLIWSAVAGACKQSHSTNKV